MATQGFNYRFSLDPDAGEVHTAQVNLDGKDYQVVITPANPTSFSEGIRKTAISLGPRGGGGPCFYCGRR